MAGEIAARAQNLFATPLIVGRIPDEGLAAALEQTILARRAAHPGVVRSNRGGWHSDLQLFQWGGPPARRLLEEIIALADRHTADASGTSGVQRQWGVEGWANVNEAGNTNMRHVHGGCYWSAVYYVRVDPGTGGALVLHDTRMPLLAMHAPSFRFVRAGGEREARVKPERGLLVLFPSWLPHEVEPWQGEGLRISIAVNLSAVRSGGAQSLKGGKGGSKAAATSLPSKEQQ